jgi:hypothetical protein
LAEVLCYKPEVADSIPSDGFVFFFNLLNPSSRTMALGFTHTLTEMSTSNLPGGKELPTREADNLTAICLPIFKKCGMLYLSQSYGPSCPVAGIALVSFLPV